MVDIKISTSLGEFIHGGKRSKVECGHTVIQWESVIGSFRVDLLCADGGQQLLPHT